MKLWAGGVYGPEARNMREVMFRRVRFQYSPAAQEKAFLKSCSAEQQLGALHNPGTSSTTGTPMSCVFCNLPAAA
jgi:hypothetical protein